MRKSFVLFSAALATLVAGCSCAPSNQPQQQAYYDQPVQQQQYAPAPVQQAQPGFLDRHGDAILAGGVGYLAGKAASKREYRNDRNYSRPRYYSRPSRPAATRYYSSSPSRSTFRSSSRGSFRSRR